MCSSIVWNRNKGCGYKQSYTKTRADAHRTAHKRKGIRPALQLARIITVMMGEFSDIHMPLHSAGSDGKSAPRPLLFTENCWSASSNKTLRLCVQRTSLRAVAEHRHFQHERDQGSSEILACTCSHATQSLRYQLKGFLHRTGLIGKQMRFLYLSNCLK